MSQIFGSEHSSIIAKLLHSKDELDEPQANSWDDYLLNLAFPLAQNVGFSSASESLRIDRRVRKPTGNSALALTL